MALTTKNTPAPGSLTTRATTLQEFASLDDFLEKVRREANPYQVLPLDVFVKLVKELKPAFYIPETFSSHGGDKIREVLFDSLAFHCEGDYVHELIVWAYEVYVLRWEDEDLRNNPDGLAYERAYNNLWLAKDERQLQAAFAAYEQLRRDRIHLAYQFAFDQWKYFVYKLSDLEALLNLTPSQLMLRGTPDYGKVASPFLPLDNLALRFERYAPNSLAVKQAPELYGQRAVGDIRIAHTQQNKRVLDVAIAATVNRYIARMKPHFEDFIRRIRAALVAPSPSSVTVTEIPSSPVLMPETTRGASW